MFMNGKKQTWTDEGGETETFVCCVNWPSVCKSMWNAESERNNVTCSQHIKMISMTSCWWQHFTISNVVDKINAKKWEQKLSAMLTGPECYQKKCHLNAIILICCVISWHYFTYVKCDAFKSFVFAYRAIKNKDERKTIRKRNQVPKVIYDKLNQTKNKHKPNSFSFLLLEIWFKFENYEHHGQWTGRKINMEQGDNS